MSNKLRVTITITSLVLIVILVAGMLYIVLSSRKENQVILTGKKSTLPLSPTLFVSHSPAKEAGASAIITQAINQKIEAKVTRVIDGDTFEIEEGQRVRMIGIDTPETVDPNRKSGCFGKEAAEKTRELLGGATVELERDVSGTDRYGRLLRYVYKDGIFINELLVSEGYAVVSTFPPDVKYIDMFLLAEAKARSNKKGLWPVCFNQN